MPPRLVTPVVVSPSRPLSPFQVDMASSQRDTIYSRKGQKRDARLLSGQGNAPSDCYKIPKKGPANADPAEASSSSSDFLTCAAEGVKHLAYYVHDRGNDDDPNQRHSSPAIGIIIDDSDDEGLGDREPTRDSDDQENTQGYAPGNPTDHAQGTSAVSTENLGDRDSSSPALGTHTRSTKTIDPYVTPIAK